MGSLVLGGGGAVSCMLGVLSGLLFARYQQSLVPIEDQPTVLAIDLGTTHSSAGIYQDGRVKVIGADKDKLVMPSYVCFKPDGQLLVGEDAKDQESELPEHTVYGVKRLIGRFWEDPVVQRHRETVSYILVNKDNRPHVEVHLTHGVQHYSPEHICAIIVRSMKERVEKYLHANVTETVVSVPTHFSNAQREATKGFCEQAGLNVKRMVNKPTAAAIAYGFNKEKDTEKESVKETEAEEKPSEDGAGVEETEKKETKKVLVCDLGADSLDVSLVSIHGRVFEVLTTGGDPYLGGEDFTRQTTEYFKKRFMEKFGKKPDVSKASRLQLYRQVEQAKIALSTSDTAHVHVHDYSPGTDLSETLSRTVFEQLNVDLFDKIKKAIDQVMKESKLSRAEIDDILLTGGSTKMPKVKQVFKDYFDGKEPIQDGVSDDAIINGTILQAAQVNNNSVTFTLYEVTPLTLGISTKHDLMSALIRRNTRIPTNSTESYTTTSDYQTEASIQIYEGERPLASRNSLLGEYTLTGIPPAPRSKQSIDVTFSVDADGILSVNATVQSTRKAAGITVKKFLNKRAADDVDKMLRHGEDFAASDKAELRRRTALLHYEQRLVYLRNDVINDPASCRQLPKSKHRALEEAVQAGLAWLDNAEDEARNVYTRKKKELDELVNEILK